MELISVGKRESEQFMGQCEVCKAYWLATADELIPIWSNWADITLVAQCTHTNCGGLGRERVRFFPVLEHGHGRDLWNLAHGQVNGKPNGKTELEAIGERVAKIEAAVKRIDDYLWEQNEYQWEQSERA